MSSINFGNINAILNNYLEHYAKCEACGGQGNCGAYAGYYVSQGKIRLAAFHDDNNVIICQKCMEAYWLKVNKETKLGRQHK